MVDLADNALTLLATVQAELGVEGESVLLTRMINAASAFVESYCSRVFWRDPAVVERVPGYGTQYLRLSRTPVHSLGAISYDGSTVDVSTVTIADSSTGLLSRRGGWQWTADVAPDITGGMVAGTELPLYQVTYDGGWYTPKQADEGPVVRDLPYDLEAACIELVRSMWLGRSRDPFVKSERLLSWSAAYHDSSDLPPTIARMLAPYRRLV